MTFFAGTRPRRYPGKDREALRIDGLLLERRPELGLRWRATRTCHLFPGLVLIPHHVGLSGNLRLVSLSTP